MLFAPSCETALILYHFPSGLSSTFSKFLLEIFLFLSTASQDSFNIISQIISFVNTFSEIFSICFFRPPLRPYASNAAPAVLLFCVSPSRRLIYYSRFTMKCQHVNCANLICCNLPNCVHFYNSYVNIIVRQSSCSFSLSVNVTSPLYS